MNARRWMVKISAQVLGFVVVCSVGCADEPKEPTVPVKPIWQQVEKGMSTEKLVELAPKLAGEIRKQDADMYAEGTLDPWTLANGLATARDLEILAARQRRDAAAELNALKEYVKHVDAFGVRVREYFKKSGRSEIKTQFPFVDYLAADGRANLARHQGNRAGELEAHRKAAALAVDFSKAMAAQPKFESGPEPIELPLEFSSLPWRHLARIAELEETEANRTAVVDALRRHVVYCSAIEQRIMALTRAGAAGGEFERFRLTQYALAKATADWARVKGEKGVADALERRLPQYAEYVVEPLEAAFQSGTERVETMLNMMQVCDREHHRLDPNHERKSLVCKCAEKLLRGGGPLYEKQTPPRYSWIAGMYIIARLESEPPKPSRK